MVAALAGTLYVDFEGRLGKLDAARHKAERDVADTRRRIDKDSQSNVFGDRFLRKALGIGASIQAINLASHALGTGMERIVIGGENATQVWREMSSEFITSLPIIGGLTKFTALAGAEFIGLGERIRASNERLQELNAEIARNSAFGQLFRTGRSQIAAGEIALSAGPSDREQADAAAKIERQTAFARFDARMVEASKFTGLQRTQLEEQARQQRSIELSLIQKTFDGRLNKIKENLERERDARHDAAVDAAMAETEAREQALEHQMRLEKRMADQREEIIRESNERLEELNTQAFEDSTRERFQAAMQPFGFGGAGSFQSSGLGGVKPPDLRKQKVEDERLRRTNELLEQIKAQMPTSTGATAQP